ncbi:MAG: hypothetical protein Q4G61_11425, partial [Tissierellia bacterium]|nr:hypothetical protein [Tissierellia bacterium]
MKSRLTRRLILYFLLVLIAFAVLLGGLFAVLGERNFREQYRKTLLKRADSIATTIESHPDLFTKGEDESDGISKELATEDGENPETVDSNSKELQLSESDPGIDQKGIGGSHGQGQGQGSGQGQGMG